MVGVLPIGQHFPDDLRHAAFFWSLKGKDYKQWKAVGLEPWKQCLRELWPETELLMSTITSAEQMTMAYYDHAALWQQTGLHRRRRPFHQPAIGAGREHGPH